MKLYRYRGMETVEGGEFIKEVSVEAVASLQHTQGSQGLVSDIQEDVPGEALCSVGQGSEGVKGQG